MNNHNDTSKYLTKPFLLALVLSAFILACNRPSGLPVTMEFSPLWDTVSPLENPHKGWYHHMLDNGIDKYEIRNDSLFDAFPGMDHLYIRLAWAFLEPEEGVFDWSYIDNIVGKYVPLGYGISFRISCKETGWVPNSIPEEIEGVGYATPYWVRKAGAMGTVPSKLGRPVWTPDWDDPVYLGETGQFSPGLR